MLRKNRYDQVLELAIEMARTNPAEVDYNWIAHALQGVLECPSAAFSEVGKDGVRGLGWPQTQLTTGLMTDVTRRNMERHPLIQHYIHTADRWPSPT
jgi:hypothetical protein